MRYCVRRWLDMFSYLQCSGIIAMHSVVLTLYQIQLSLLI